jgi:hypothetical protein
MTWHRFRFQPIPDTQERRTVKSSRTASGEYWSGVNGKLRRIIAAGIWGSMMGVHGQWRLPQAIQGDNDL